MKILSIRQPWASLVVHGLKRCETRRWATLFRGPLAIHAARRFPGPQRRRCIEPPVRILLAAAGIADIGQLPLGTIVGVATVVDCVPASEWADQLEPIERQLGDYGDEMYAWLLADAVALANPIPYVGQLGLCELAEDLVTELTAGR
jgi:activating signal cointegrator 1